MVGKGSEAYPQPSNFNRPQCGNVSIITVKYAGTSLLTSTIMSRKYKRISERELGHCSDLGNASTKSKKRKHSAMDPTPQASQAPSAKKAKSNAYPFGKHDVPVELMLKVSFSNSRTWERSSSPRNRFSNTLIRVLFSACRVQARDYMES